MGCFPVYRDWHLTLGWYWILWTLLPIWNMKMTHYEQSPWRGQKDQRWGTKEFWWKELGWVHILQQYQQGLVVLGSQQKNSVSSVCVNNCVNVTYYISIHFLSLLFWQGENLTSRKDLIQSSLTIIPRTCCWVNILCKQFLILEVDSVRVLWFYPWS